MQGWARSQFPKPVTFEKPFILAIYTRVALISVRHRLQNTLKSRNVSFPAGAAAASRLYVEAINKLARQAQHGTWGGSSDVGKCKISTPHSCSDCVMVGMFVD
jgi:hypothetical protein